MPLIIKKLHPIKIIAFLIGLLITGSAASATTLSYTGNLYTEFDNDTLVPGEYLSTQNLSATFVLNNSLAAGLSNVDIQESGLVTSFSAFDGRSNFETNDLLRFSVSTDSTGLIVSWLWEAEFEDKDGEKPSGTILSVSNQDGNVFILEDARFRYYCGGLIDCEPGDYRDDKAFYLNTESADPGNVWRVDNLNIT